MNSSLALPDLLVAEHILRRLQRTPAAPALYFHDLCISNAALLHKVLRLADCLREHGVGRHDRVAVGMGRCPEFLVALLALWHCGAVYIPLDPALPRERLLNMCSVAAPDCLITQPHLEAVLGTLPLPLLTLDSMDFAAAPAGSSQDTVHAGTAGTPTGTASVNAFDSTQACSGTACAPNDPAYILFTSGSTGLPKGVLISQGNLLALFRGILPLLQMDHGQRVLACASFSFDIALYELLAPLLCGGSIVLADDATSRDPELLARLIVDMRVDVVQATPSLWQLLVRQHWNPERRAVLAMATGEALPRTLARAILADTPLLWNLYGPTECTLWASAYRVTEADLVESAPTLVSIGKALPGYALALCAAHGQPPDPDSARLCYPAHESSPGQVLREALADNRQPQASGDMFAELWIGGAGIGQGYCGEPELSAAAFLSVPDAGGSLLDADGSLPDVGGSSSDLGVSSPDAGASLPNVGQAEAHSRHAGSIRETHLERCSRWYRSGDLCRRDSAANFHCAGRLDAQVKVNGYRIEPGEIALLLQQHASISEAVCLTRPLPEPRGTLLFACLVFIPGMPNKNRHSLNQYLARHLPAWMLPQRYYFLDHLPLTPHGKLDRAALLALTASSPRPPAHADDLHGRVARVFCEVLDIDSIGPCDSFLDAGGSSMLGATLVMLLNQRFATRISLRQALATPPTVQSIARLLRNATVSEGGFKV